MKSKDILTNALKRSKKERGLKVINPNDDLSKGHIEKSNHDLVVMTDLYKMRHEDWVVIAAYYAMYQAALALLTKIGLESKEHATTLAVLEYFFGEQITKELLEEFNTIKEKKDKIEAIIITKTYIDSLWKVKQARESVQYGISIEYKETNAIIENARKFTSKIKLVINELDENLLKIINKKINILKELK